MRWVEGKSAGNLAQADERAGRGGTLTFDVEVGGQIRVQDDGVSKRAFLCDAFELERERVEARPQSFHEEEFLLLCELEQCLKFCRVRRCRFLAQNVLSGVQSIKSILIVERMRCTYQSAL